MANKSTRFVRLAARLAFAAFWAGTAPLGCGSDNGSTPEPQPSQPVDASVETGPSCTAGLAACSGACVDKTKDPNNCGACGAVCDTGLVCSNGKCAISCDGGMKCGNSCYDITADPLNCGACGAKCPAGQVCNNGSCALACAGGTVKCGTACVDTKVDPSNCGSCGTQCGAGRVCANGQCAFTCAAGLIACGLADAGSDAGDDAGAAYCANTASDNRNCGGCGKKCDPGQTCDNGACSYTCRAGLLSCGGSCIDPSTDRQHCGAVAGCDPDAGTAGTACPDDQVCSAGACRLSCQTGLVNCGGNCIDPLADRLHCGAVAGCNQDAGTAGAACNEGQVCNAGSCRLSCQTGLVNCGGKCIDPLADRLHCGAIAGCSPDAGTAGAACNDGQVCSAGACAPSCQAGQVACNGSCIDPSNNRQYCGATLGCGVGDAGSAGTACAAGKVCAAGVCALSCPVGLLDCNGTCIDPSTDRQYCGATPGCGLGDAGSSAGATCAAGQVCSAGSCRLSCQQGLLTCGDTCIDPLTSRSFCGASANCDVDAGTTGTACAEGEVCSAGTCRLSCQPGLLSCGGKCIDPSTDRQFCGATAGCGADGGTTGTPCADGQVCSGGTCQASCQGGLVACAGACIDPSTNNQYCGATPGCGAGGAGTAGSACAANQTCFRSGCRSTNCSRNLALSSTPGYVTASVSSLAVGSEDLMIDGIGKASCSNSSFASVSNGPYASGAWAELRWSELQDIDSFFIQTDDGAQFIGGDLTLANDKLGQCWTGNVPPGARNIASATVQWWDYDMPGEDAGLGNWHDAGSFSGQTGNVRFDFPTRVSTTKIRIFDMTTALGNGYGGNSIIWEWHVYSAIGCQPTL
jgi:hypothetical protein